MQRSLVSITDTMSNQELDADGWGGWGRSAKSTISKKSKKSKEKGRPRHQDLSDELPANGESSSQAFEAMPDEPMPEEPVPVDPFLEAAAEEPAEMPPEEPPGVDVSELVDDNLLSGNVVPPPPPRSGFDGAIVDSDSDSIDDASEVMSRPTQINPRQG